MPAKPVSPSSEFLGHPKRALWGFLLLLLLLSAVCVGVYKDAQLRRGGLARRALVVNNRRERGANLLTLRFAYGPDTLTATYREHHRRRIQQLQPGDSATVRFWPDAPERVQVAGK